MTNIYAHHPSTLNCSAMLCILSWVDQKHIKTKPIKSSNGTDRSPFPMAKTRPKNKTHQTQMMVAKVRIGLWIDSTKVGLKAAITLKHNKHIYTLIINNVTTSNTQNITKFEEQHATAKMKTFKGIFFNKYYS